VFPYGVGMALFGPAFHSIVPTIVPEDQLVEANSIGQVVRPLCFTVIGPLIGGLLVTLGTGWAFIADAATFVVSALCIAGMRIRRVPSSEERTDLLTDIREGVGYVRGTPWILWGLLAGLVSLFAVFGPWETLVPFIVSDQLHASGLGLALVYGAGGAGSVLIGLTMAQRGGLPPKPVTVMYVAFSIGMGMTAGFGFIGAVWQGMVVAFIAESAIALLVVIWFTLLQRLVPNDLLGRVSALDWMISISGAPVSFLIVGPLAGAIGADAVLIGAGILGAVAPLLFLVMPGARDPERDGSLAEPAVTPA
jgi:hypothetical protein